VIYTSFLIVQRFFYSSRTFENDVPWGSLEVKYGFLKLVLKLILTCSFVFDKQANVQGYVHIICSLISALIVFNRVTRSIIIQDAVHKTMLIYETLLTWLFASFGA
jgi:hypothetical protein